MKSYWIKVDPKSSDWCLIRRERDTEAQRHTGRISLRMEAGNARVYLHARERQGLPAARSWWR